MSSKPTAINDAETTTPGANNYRYLAISALGPDQPGIVREISRAALDSGCNILDSHMTSLGTEFAVLLLVTGNWNTLTRLEKKLASVAKKLDISMVTRPSNEPKLHAKLMPYAIEVVAIDHPGIVFRLADFFTSRKMNISDMVTNIYAAAHTGTAMFSLQMAVHLPESIQIASLREEFMDFCDQYNLDAIMEPLKGSA